MDIAINQLVECILPFVNFKLRSFSNKKNEDYKKTDEKMSLLEQARVELKKDTYTVVVFIIIRSIRKKLLSFDKVYSSLTISALCFKTLILKFGIKKTLQENYCDFKASNIF